MPWKNLTCNEVIDWLKTKDPNSEVNIYAGCCMCSEEGEIRVNGDSLELTSYIP